MEELLLRFGIKKEELNAQELVTLKNWAESLQKNTLSLTDVQNYIVDMISSVERELTGYEYPKDFSSFLFKKRRMRHLQARLYNYIMLRDFLMAPQKARSYIEKHIKNLDFTKVNGQKN